MPGLLELVAEDLTGDVDRYGERVLAQIARELPPIVADGELRRLAHSGTIALLRQFAEALRVGLAADHHAPPATTAYAIRLAAAGVPLTDVLRSYRLGQEAVIGVATELAGRADDPDPRAALSDLIGRSFRFVDGVVGDITHSYQGERDRVLRRDQARGAAIVARLLAGEPVARERAERTLRYRLDGPHLALVCWSAASEEGEPAAPVERLTEAVRPLTAGRPLVLADGPAAAVAWVTRADEPDPREAAALAAALAPAGLRVALGDPRPGPAGFVRSRQQADRAAAHARRDPGPTVVRHRDVALLTLLLADEPAARAFARDELGPLAGDDPASARLRAALTALHAAGHDRSRAARALGVHRNTVARRLRRAEERLGRPLEARPRELEAALAIVAALDARRPGEPG
ncbi:PucR family transcriptional regulator [Patulibacter defluvii]|uniref:PucR family transcriptional regulator n=1 Tax=Patulibacter defluvii TaxID=3095358 RepID=UPI002A7563C1|nr:helix-turn-helix domain-containing protein [Patulibacter sp. DM4]